MSMRSQVAVCPSKDYKGGFRKVFTLSGKAPCSQLVLKVAKDEADNANEIRTANSLSLSVYQGLHKRVAAVNIQARFCVSCALSAFRESHTPGTFSATCVTPAGRHGGRKEKELESHVLGHYLQG